MGAASADCNIWWSEVYHDTFDTDYRSTIGAVDTTTGTIKLRLRVAQSDITSAYVRVYDDYTNVTNYYSMSWDGSYDTDTTTYDWWYVDITKPTYPTILYYYFQINDAPGSCAADQDWYEDDDVSFYGGGTGEMLDVEDTLSSFQITVYDPAFDVPEWMQTGIVYQIFPERFRDTDTSNDKPAGEFFYNVGGGTIYRSNGSDWNTAICDPRDLNPTLAYNCYAGDAGYSGNFYGGDLEGITEKINAGYFDNLGVSVIYLNPIFESPSNHKYDTANYLSIAEDFGTLADFEAMAAAADAHGIKIILDGVFNHTSSDSTYFDYYSRYDSSGALTSPTGPGADDNSGACEGGSSSYYSWFYFPDNGTPANNGGVPVYCYNGAADAAQTYEAWYGYPSLPKLQAGLTAVRNLIFDSGALSVGPYWVSEGASGWRFDVGGDVDSGLVNDPTNDYWEDFRTAVRAVDGDTLLLGEEWGDASAWLLGNEWDSVMNYRFRSAVLSWLFTGCTVGNGCPTGLYFEDNDSNSSSSSGVISGLTPSLFNARLLSIWEDYPPDAFKAMMNLEGSHDTNRMRFLLKKGNSDSDASALQRMKEWWLFAFTYAGAPTLYYGDEIGLSHDGVWDGSRWQDDPYNRAPYPWDDASGTAYVPDTSLMDFARQMSSIRLSYSALQDGDVQHGLIVDDTNMVYGFARTDGSQTALIALNRSNATQIATFTGLNSAPYGLPDGTVLYDVIGDVSYTVASGQVAVSVASNWGAVLLEDAVIETPVSVSDLEVSVPTGSADVVLEWSPVITDTAGGRELATSYEIHRSASSTFVPTPGDAATLVATVTPDYYGTTDGLLSYTDSGAVTGGYYYVVLAQNTAGNWSAAATPIETWHRLIVVSTAANDGYITESAETTGRGGAINSAATTFYLGDNATDYQYLAVLSFNTASLPDDATILSAVVQIRRSGVTGTSPFTTHGTLYADVKTGYYGAGVALAANDFQAASTTAMSAVMSVATPASPWSTGSLDSAGMAAISLNSTTQVKLYFSTDDNDDMSADYMTFCSGNHATPTYRPYIVIFYTTP